MAIFDKNKFSSFFGLSDEDEFDNYEEYEEKQVVNSQPIRQAVPKKKKTAAASYRQERPSTETRVRVEEKKPARPNKEVDDNKVVAMRTTKSTKTVQEPKKNNKIRIVEPRVYSEAKNIAKHILSEEAVLVNFHLVEEYQARRIVDFMTGTVYALGGDIQRVGNEIFLCTPANMEIDGTTAQSLVKDQFYDL